MDELIESLSGSWSNQNINVSWSWILQIQLQSTPHTEVNQWIFSKETINEIYMIDLILFWLLVFVGFFKKITNFN